MGEKLKKYIESLQLLLESGDKIENIGEIKKELLAEIQFWQHERLIHLMVTFLFALLTMSTFFVFVFYQSIAVLVLLLALLILLVPYIMHYYRLENGVQTLYVFYEELTRREKSGKISEVCVPKLKGVVIKPLKQKDKKK